MKKMIELTDEILMAYADGWLDQSQGREIESLCARTPALRARLEIFRATGTELGRPFQQHVGSAVPEHLLEFVKALGRQRAGGKRRRARPLTLRTAAVASVATLMGTGLGWLLHAAAGGQGVVLASLVHAENGRLIARAPLQNSLDTLHSGTRAKLSLAGPPDAELKVKMTFRNEDRDYCREYEIATASPERYPGVACRTGGQWSIRIQAMIPSSEASPGRFVLAGTNNQAMDAVVRSLLDEGPLSPDEEAVLIKDWKKPARLP